MDNRRTYPPLHEIARLVTLYRARNVKPYQWDSVGDALHRQVLELTRARHRLLRVAHTIGRELHEHIPAADELAAAAVAYVLIDDGQSLDVARRFVVPGHGGEQLEDGDPRTAMRRALADLPVGARPQRTMGLMLKAWGMWVTGSTCRELSWREDSPIPRVAGWPSFAIPAPPDHPQ